jgi:pyrophosphatase PpaX
MPKVAALLLDLDGTIADTHDLIFDCLEHALKVHAGLPLGRDQWEELFIGMPLHEVYPAVFAGAGRAGPEQALSDELTRCYRARQREMEPAVQAFPGVVEALEALRNKGVRLAVVTTKHEASAVRTLAHLGLSEHFEAVVCGDHCANYKPHPEPFVTAAERIGVPVASCAGAGDSPLDIEAARAAGAVTIAACWGCLSRSQLLSTQPDHVAEGPSDLLRILN